MDVIYLDNNATTRPAEPVVAAMREMLEANWANPSSVHRFGQLARQRVELARASVAKLIACRDRELIFTSGGTEANNLALRGVLDAPAPGSTPASDTARLAGDRRSPRSGANDRDDNPSQPLAARRVLITTPVEHSAVREPAAALAERGVELVMLPIDINGCVTPEDVNAALEEHVHPGDTTLVSVQWVNNETGVIQPVEAIAEVVRDFDARMKNQRSHKAASDGGRSQSRTRVLFHVDGTQAVGKMRVDVKTTGFDMMTLAAHKFHGPKGVGALYVRTGVKLSPGNLGGPQERDRRGGTENTPGVVGLGVAADLAREFVADEKLIAALRELRDSFEQRIVTELPDTVVNSAGGPRIWNTSNLGFPRLEAEAILLALSERGVCASAGAACSSGSLDPSPVLLAMGVPEPVAHGSVRFSISRYSTADEIDRAVEVIVQCVNKLSRTLPVG